MLRTPCSDHAAPAARRTTLIATRGSPHPCAPSDKEPAIRLGALVYMKKSSLAAAKSAMIDALYELLLNLLGDGKVIDDPDKLAAFRDALKDVLHSKAWATQMRSNGHYYDTDKGVWTYPELPQFQLLNNPLSYFRPFIAALLAQLLLAFNRSHPANAG